MECNECGKETDSIMVICPECDGKKDEQIAALQAQLADLEAELGECRDNLRFYKEQTDFRGQQIMKMRGET